MVKTDEVLAITRLSATRDSSGGARMLNVPITPELLGHLCEMSKYSGVAINDFVRVAVATYVVQQLKIK